MSKELISIKDIKELNKLLRQVFEYLTNLKEKHKLADKITYPRLPSTMTESLALHLLRKKTIISKLKGFEFNFGDGVADILATKGSQTIKIEVKATAKSGFEYFGEKDISADYILWVHFAGFYLNPEETNIEIYIIKNPRAYFKKPLKIVLLKLKKIIGDNLEKIDFDINSL